MVNKKQDEEGLVYIKETTKNKNGKIIDKNTKILLAVQMSQQATVTIGTNIQSICVPGNQQ